MEYRSIGDLSDTIFMNAYKIPADVDVIVGIPRSGMLAASMMAIHLNLPLLDLDGFIANRTPSVGITVKRTMSWGAGQAFRKALVVDDSVLSGESIRAAKEQIKAADIDTEVVFCAVYGSRSEHSEVDFCLETVPFPRAFQWNLMRHKSLKDACVDIDGVLCHDPSRDQNDDGSNYLNFLKTSRRLLIPREEIGHLVTSRLEKYRDSTEQWLSQHGIAYGKLWMLDLPSAEERRRQGAHASFKASVYQQTDATFFIESEDVQAGEIAELSGKPVLSIEGQRVIWPGNDSRAKRIYNRRAKRGDWKDTNIRRFLVSVIGEKRVRKLGGLIAK